MTGGLQEQVTDGKDWFGIGLNPSSKSIIGSQEVPWIYEDRLDGKQVTDALVRFYNMSKTEREHMGKLGRKHVLKEYGQSKYAGNWYQLFERVTKEYGSWDSRVNYKSWEISEL